MDTREQQIIPSQTVPAESSPAEPTETIKVELFSDGLLPNSTVFVLGATGCGKTVLIANLLRDRPRVLILDTRDEYPAGFFGTPDQVAICKDMHEMIVALNQGKPVIIAKIPPMSNEEEFVNGLCFRVMDFQKRNPQLPPITIAMDEFNKFVSVQYCSPGIKEIVQRGRGLKIEKVFGAQWFNTCPTFARDSFSEIYVFRHSEPRGLQMLSLYGFQPQEIATLPAHTVQRMHNGEITTIKLLAIKSKKKESVTT